MTTASPGATDPTLRTPQYVYRFGGGRADGSADMRNLLGGKGAGLAEMTAIGIPVPPGFTITTEVCTAFYANGRKYPEGLETQVAESLAYVEGLLGRRFGDPANPLLFSVRSGARVSMPGMMDTVLNLGLNDAIAEGLARQSGDRRFAFDSYRRFVQMYGDVVLGLKPEGNEEDPFETILEAKKRQRGVHLDTDLTADDLIDLVAQFKAEIRRRKGIDFPEEPREQLWGAIGAVFGSWENARANTYRRIYGIPSDWGTAVNVQAMVYGNLGDDCATGVGFTRDPATGENRFYGEYLINAQGEDVVAGIRTPQPVSRYAAHDGQVALEEAMPQAYAELDQTRQTLERHYRDMQDIEFTIQQGKLWLLQTRSGKRTGFAAVRIAVDMVEEGMITSDEAIERVEPDALNHLLQPIFDVQAKREAELLTTGIPAGPGAASGRICFQALEAEALAATGEKVVLVRRETSPEDIRGMAAAEGILTALGGASSHAALVSRQMGKVCVVGCSALDIDYNANTVTVGDRVLNAGDWISIDGFPDENNRGGVFAGQIETRPSEVIQVLIAKTMQPEQSYVYQQFAKLMAWADEKRRLGVRTNADQPDQAAAAVAFGAEGIGLCRTEHMFFEGDRIDAMREMILANDIAARKLALAKLLPYQREDFEGIFREMQGRPVTIRTLDPPLHEFLPKNEQDQAELAAGLGVTVDDIARRVEELHEFNPMLGHRGCRLGIVFPEITEMQCRAIFEAATNVQKSGTAVAPEIMIPLVGFQTELMAQAEIVHATARAVLAETGVAVPYQVGTMIEVPRACVAADQIAEKAEFFSFGTNDLTQMVLGMSRDDYGGFIRYYLDNDIVPRDPFQSIDEDGVGNLMKVALEKGRIVRPDLKIGICGEHGGDPDSVRFCHRIGLNYVSCSPYRVPIARLAAAQAALRDIGDHAAKSD